MAPWNRMSMYRARNLKQSKKVFIHYGNYPYKPVYKLLRAAIRKRPSRLLALLREVLIHCRKVHANISTLMYITLLDIIILYHYYIIRSTRHALCRMSLSNFFAPWLKMILFLDDSSTLAYVYELMFDDWLKSTTWRVYVAVVVIVRLRIKVRWQLRSS